MTTKAIFQSVLASIADLHSFEFLTSETPGTENIPTSYVMIVTAAMINNDHAAYREFETAAHDALENAGFTCSFCGDADLGGYCSGWQVAAEECEEHWLIVDSF